MAISPTSSTLSTSSSGVLSSPGIGSGLDVNSIVSKLMAVASQPLQQLNQQEASYQAQLSAYGNLSSSLSQFQSAVSALDNLSQFQSLSATPSDATILSASAASSAVPGSYNVQVTQLAQAQSLAAAGQVSTTAAIGSGATTTLSFQFGTISGGTLTGGTYSGATFTQDASQATGTVTINSGNNSLQGIRDAVNAANIGVTATIINDGSAAPERLVLTSNKTGATSSMKITVTGDATLQGLLGYDPAATQNLTQNTAGQNALASVNGISISSASNTVTSAIQGVTLNLSKVGTATLNVARDTSSVQSAVQSFVSAYNTINTTLNSLTAYDPSTQQAGSLNGDFTVTMIQDQIRRALSSSITGLSGGLTTLSQIGVSFQKDGSLALDSTQLQNAITNNFNDIAGLFTSVGTATDSLVSFAGSTANTQAGSYAVNISQLATQGSVVGSAAAGLTITAGVNDQLGVTVDGTSASVTLSPGTYTAASLAAQVQSAINGAAALSAAGDGVTVTQNAGVMTITSNRYGSASNVSVSGTGAANLLGASPTAAAGVDVAGTINGGPASGSGQYLIGAVGTPTEGLKIQITGGATGARGMIDFSQGYAHQMNNLLTGLLATPGLISGRTAGINSSIQDIDNQRTELNQQLADTQSRYQAQFTALDVLIGTLSQTSSFLTQQLANLPKIGG